jgi:hypothetical protein
MITEDQVVDAVCRTLVTHGYSIKQRATVVQHGFDIVAHKDERDLVIEAKGAGSSKVGTARFGKEFNSGQVFDHVAKAVLKALRVSSSGDARAGIAFPDNALHRREVEQVVTALRQTGIGVFWVDEQKGVRVEASWDL